MSTNEEEKSTPRPASNNRRRRGPGSNNKNNKSTEPSTADAEPSSTEPKPRRERVPNVAPEAHLVGSGVEVVGLVDAYIKRGKLNFGFITLGAEAASETTPRVYFNYASMGETPVVMRRGYPVQFTIEQDEKARPSAKNVKLTAEGAIMMAEREEAISKKRSERATAEKEKPVKQEQPPKEAVAEGEKVERKEKSKRPRKRIEGRSVTLVVKVEGSAEEKTVEIVVNQSIGKLKSLAAAALGASIESSVYLPTGEFLTKTLLSKLNDNDTVVLGPKKETPSA